MKNYSESRIELQNLQIVRTQNTMQVSLVVISLDVKKIRWENLRLRSTLHLIRVYVMGPFRWPRSRVDNSIVLSKEIIARRNAKADDCEIVFWILKGIPLTWPISRVFCLEFDLQKCKMIYIFVKPHLYFICIRFTTFFIWKLVLSYQTEKQNISLENDLLMRTVINSLLFVFLTTIYFIQKY